MSSWITSHLDPQSLGFWFIAAVDAVFYLLLLLFLVDRFISHFLHKGFHEDRKPLHPVLKLALSYASLLSVTYTFTILLIGMEEAFSSWRLDYDSYFLIFNFIFYLVVAAIVTKRQFLPTGLHVFWAVNYFNITTMLYVPSSFSRAIFREVMLPNDLLSLVTLPISIVLIIIVIQENSGFIGAHDLKEKNVVGDDVVSLTYSN